MNTTTINRKKIHQVLNGNDPVTANDIKYAMSLAGLTQTAIANKANVSKQTVGHIISGYRTSFNVASIISAELGVSLRKIWPDGRYNKTPKKTREAA